MIYSEITHEFVEKFYPDGYKRYGYAPYDFEEDYTLTPAEKMAGDKYTYLSHIEPMQKLRVLTEDLVYRYENISYFTERFGEATDLEVSKNGIARIKEICTNGEILNILPSYNTALMRQLYQITAYMILASVFLLLAPVITKDNMSGVRDLQYSSKTGRKTRIKQLWVYISVGFIVSIIEVAAATVWRPFLNSGLNSFFDGYNYNWFTGNCRQYLIIVAS